MMMLEPKEWGRCLRAHSLRMSRGAKYKKGRVPLQLRCERVIQGRIRFLKDTLTVETVHPKARSAFQYVAQIQWEPFKEAGRKYQKEISMQRQQREKRLSQTGKVASRYTFLMNDTVDAAAFYTWGADEGE